MEGFPKEVLCIKDITANDRVSKVKSGETYKALGVYRNEYYPELYGYEVAEFPSNTIRGKLMWVTTAFVDMTPTEEELALFKEKEEPCLI